MASLIIGVTGQKRSGKDTFAERLVSAHGFTRVAFSDIMRDAVAALDPILRVEADERGFFGWRPDSGHRHLHLSAVLADHGWDTVKATREGRRLLQRFGTEAGREIHGEDVWVDLTADKVDAIPGPVVITDVRFPNEADYVTDFGVLVRVTRPGLESTDTHASETALADYDADYDVDNSRSVSSLHAQADAVLRFVRAEIV